MEHLIYAVGVVATLTCFVMALLFEYEEWKQRKLASWIDDEESQYLRSRRRYKKRPAAKE